MTVTRSPEPLVIGIGFVPILGALVSLLIYPDYMNIEAILIAFLGSFSFIFTIYSFSLLGIRQSKTKDLVVNFKIKERASFIFIALFVVGAIGTVNLVVLFVTNFGVDGLLFRPDLFQSNAIVNSYGYLLYLNVFVLSLFSVAKPRKISTKFVYAVFAIVTILSLVFSGNKSYFFQAIILFLFVKSNGGIKSAAKRGIVFLGLIIILFAAYDKFIDFADSNSIFDRPIAYIFGGWPTLQSFIADGGYSSTYIGDHLFYPIIKIITSGGFPEETLFKFFDIDGYDLNQFSIFGSAYLDFWYFGVIFVGFLLGAIEWFFRRKMYSRKNGLWTLVYWYFITELLLSFFFANMFGNLYFYTSLIILIFLNYVYVFLNKVFYC